MAESASRLSRLLDRNLAILTDQPGPPLVVGAIILAMALIRSTLFPGTGGDDGEQLIFSQFFAWGYQVRNPPWPGWPPWPPCCSISWPGKSSPGSATRS